MTWRSEGNLWELVFSTAWVTGMILRTQAQPWATQEAPLTLIKDLCSFKIANDEL